MSRRTVEVARVRAAAALAADAIAPAWPLTTFVAVNPLLGFEDRPFAAATAAAAELFRARTLPPVPGGPAIGNDADGTDAAQRLIDRLGVVDTLADWGPSLGRSDLVERLDARCGRWLAAFCDRGEASVAMPRRGDGFFAEWRRCARHEGGIGPWGARYRRAFDALPARADEMLHANLAALDIPPALHVGYLRRHLAAIAGWSGLVKYLADDGAPIDTLGVLAMRTWYERCELGAAVRAERIAPTFPAIAAWLRAEPDRVRTPRAFDPVAHARALHVLEAREERYRDALLATLAPAGGERADAPAAQLVFCIDARSEPLRRALERRGPYETIGFAGFFGFAFRYRPFDAVNATAQAPVLLRPPVTVGEAPDAGDARAARSGADRGETLRAAYGKALRSPLGAFAGVELAGLPAILRAAWATLRPSRRAPAVTALPLDLAALRLDERIAAAEAALRIMGLTRGFAPLVVLCGHGGGTVNNAFAAALDCGACGGNRGLINARVAAAVFNDAPVRHGLAERGIVIPPETHFVAAEHDTTRDRVHVLDAGVPAAHAPPLAELRAALDAAGAATRARRTPALPVPPLGPGDPLARAADWAQPRPEWGLARNAALVIAPRRVTRDADLDGRCFLHSYEPDDDPDGSVLEQILTAPLIVAQWINAQYFFATVDPERFGSGDKYLQQPVAGLGVIAGNGGDLRTGLPLQSTHADDAAVHEPLRLLTVVCAPAARIDAIVARQAAVRRIVEHRWVRLVALDPADGTRRAYAGAGVWNVLDRTEKPACPLTV